MGAAIAAPSTLALLQISFREGPERTRAVGAYSAVAGGGGSIGLVLGGMLTTWISWRWGLFINVPDRHRPGPPGPALPARDRAPARPFRPLGAVTSTLGMTSLVYGFVRAASSGWGDPITVASFVAGAALLAAFVVTEMRAEQPITPLHLFASRERTGAYVARMLVVSGMFAMFFFMTQYFQGVLGYSALQSGLAFLPVTAVMFGAVRLVPRMAPRFGSVRLLAGGVFAAFVGMAWLSRLSAGTPFFPQIVLPMALLGIGIGTAFVPLTTAGIAGVRPDDAGAASGLVNVAQQLGGSLGLGILVTVFASASHTAARLTAGRRLRPHGGPAGAGPRRGHRPHRVGGLPGPGLRGHPGGDATFGRQGPGFRAGGCADPGALRPGPGLIGDQRVRTTLTAPVSEARANTS